MSNKDSNTEFVWNFNREKKESKGHKKRGERERDVKSQKRQL